MLREYRFAPPRRFRFDFADPVTLIAVEIEGGNWTGGRHTRGSGFEMDCKKYNLAALRGWKVFRFTSGMLRADPVGCVGIVMEAMRQAQTSPRKSAANGGGESL